MVDRIAALGTGGHRPSKRELAELAALLSGGCVQLPDAPAQRARKDLASTGRPAVTLATAVAAMRRSFAEVTDVTSAVEAVWAAVGPPLDAAEAELGSSRALAAGLGSETEAAFQDAEAGLDALRSASNTDPLALISDGRVDTSAADRLQAQVAELGRRVAELGRLRSRPAAGSTRSKPPPRPPGPTGRRRWRPASARPRWSRSRWRPRRTSPNPGWRACRRWQRAPRSGRLQAELDRCEAELATSRAQTEELRRLAAAAVARRDELRGLLGAYKAKAARLGASEDVAVSGQYDHARDLLWSAPCDLGAAEAAVSGYQQAILATERRR